jgi:hypothetical protein
MSINWDKAVTDPIGLAGFALSLLFGVVALVVKRRKPSSAWIVPTGLILATVCILGGLGLAWQRQAHSSPAPHIPSASAATPTIQKMDLHDIHQNTNCGPAVAGVQGDVTIDSNSSGNSKNCNQQTPK